VTLEAQCPGVISDHAVFQQGIPVTIWGTSLPKATVKVRFAGQTKSTVSDDDGRWRVALDPMAADKLDSLREVPGGQPLTIDTELDGKKALKEFKDILVGEVWLCSGQSNMAGKVRHNHANQDPNDNLLESNFPAIRHISAPDGWRSAVPGSVGEFTRVGFCFARKVHREIKVPIGLVNACRGGSRIESWMRAPPKDLPESEAGKKKVAYGGLYRERIVPLIGYGMRGALWYQGEANASEGHSYFLKMESLIADWRASWKLGDFPFYFVQLAGIGRSPTDNPAMGDGRARIREAQRRALTIDNAGMAVAIDIGAEREHPANKVEVGERLAHWALHHDYGRKDILPSGPLYQGCEIEGKTIRISFDHAQGLMFASKEDYAPPVPTPEAKIPWLSIQAKDGTWHWAEGQIDDQDLIVSSKEVKEPVAVRYAYTNRPLGPYLYNKDGLPASPFTTEATHIKP
jgi:sialate O-acetylesterase